MFVEGWKTLVVDRVCNSMVATLPKIFHSLRRVGANVETVANKLYEMDRGASGSGSPSSGETLNLKTESQSPRFSGSAGRTAEFAQPSSRVSGRISLGARRAGGQDGDAHQTRERARVTAAVFLF